ncbi:C39 family peptidase [Limosilactobacillus mucosae]
MKHNRRYLFMATAALTAFILTGTTSIKANADDSQATEITTQQTVSVADQGGSSVDGAVTSDSQSNASLSVDTNNADIKESNSTSDNGSSIKTEESQTNQSTAEDTNVSMGTAAASAPKNQFVTNANGKISYYDNNGQKVAGSGNTADTLAYRTINGNTYAFDNNGNAYTGFLSGWGNMYYFDNNGARYTDRFYNNWGNTYYFGQDGVRYTNRWYYNWGNYYYFGDGGVRLTDAFLPNKQLPLNDGKGGLKDTDQVHVYYFNPETGVMARDQFYNNWGHTYYFGVDGARYTDQFYNNWGNTYYFDNDGALYTDKFYNNWGNTYYFDKNGVRYTNQWYSNWGHKYFFGNGGVRATNEYFNALGAGGDYDTHWADQNGVVSDVHYFSQYTPVFAPWGCAGASLAMILSIKNVYPDLKDLIYNEPNVTGSRNQGWEGGQSGSVVSGIGFDHVIQPNALSRYGQMFYSGVRDIPYTSLSNIADVVRSGHPVIYYGWSAYDAGGARNHCKVILGYNVQNDTYHVYDPLYGYKNRWTANSTGHNRYDLGYDAWVKASSIQIEMNGQAISIY